jgi:hypothetical protein
MPKKSETKEINKSKISINELQKQIKILEKKISQLEITTKNNKQLKIKNKDPKKPKKYKTAYMFFNIERVEEFKKKNPNTKINIIEIAKENSEKWKKVKEDEKIYEKYKKLENKDKNRYKKELDTYNK